MPRGRPKGSKNKPKAAEETKKTLILEPVSEPENEIEDKVEDKKVEIDIESKNDEPIKTDEGKVDETKVPKTGKVKKKEYPTCDICGTECLCDRTKLNLTYLTGKAPWHREVKGDIFHICPNCAEALNKLIDNWLLEHGVSPKFVPLDEDKTEDVDITNIDEFIKNKEIIKDAQS